MELTDSLKALFMETARSLKGSARRLFMARTVKELGPGGQQHAERALGWSRVSIRKGMHELESGFTCLDAFAARCTPQKLIFHFTERLIQPQLRLTHQEPWIRSTKGIF